MSKSKTWILSLSPSSSSVLFSDWELLNQYHYKVTNKTDFPLVPSNQDPGYRYLKMLCLTWAHIDIFY